MDKMNRIKLSHLADKEHDWPLATANTPHVVQTGYSVLDVEEKLGPFQSSTVCVCVCVGM